jgi:small conductance mechanosensitive channel
MSKLSFIKKSGGYRIFHQIQHQTRYQARWLCRFILGSFVTLLVLFSSTIDVPAIDVPAIDVPAIAHSINLPIGLGQLPSLSTPATEQPLPANVQRRGTLETAPVRLDGLDLFRIASPTVLDRSKLNNQIPVEVRAKQIESNLENLIAANSLSEETILNPKTMRVVVETLNGQPVLFVKDTTLAEAKVLLTVTDADAQYHSTSKEKLATQWQQILERELRQALELRQPEAVKQQISTVIKTSITTVVLTVLLGAAWTVVRQRKQQLEQEQATEMAAIHVQEPIETDTVEPIEPFNVEQRQPFFQGLGEHFGLERRLQIIRFLRWLIFWAIALTWMIGLAYSLDTFPQTRQFARKVVYIPVVLLIAWFLTGLLNQVTDVLTDRFIQRREQEQSLTEANLQRISTIANVLKGLKTVLLYSTIMLWVLQRLDLVPGAILTLGAVFALAVSFAVQSLIKDLVNGFLILLEDQFRIGDRIKIGSASGLVVNLNLRITQIRSDEGHLITLPNSLITEVENMSRTWARTDFRVEVAYNTDVDRALAVVRETVDRMAEDPDWQSEILDTQELFGVDKISHTGIVIRILIKTAPLRQWAIARELRRRLKIAFDLNSIQIGTPQQICLNAPFEINGAIDPTPNPEQNLME